jgi:hypothetical protein
MVLLLTRALLSGASQWEIVLGTKKKWKLKLKPRAILIAQLVWFGKQLTIEQPLLARHSGVNQLAD